jgi:hypothetical protein
LIEVFAEIDTPDLFFGAGAGVGNDDLCPIRAEAKQDDEMTVGAGEGGVAKLSPLKGEADDDGMTLFGEGDDSIP